MSSLDWLVITVYIIAMIGLSVYLGRRQSDQDDYFVGGRSLSWWSVGLSTMATQTSSISFISIPAFVALKPGGGLNWLQYELAVPLAMIAVMVFLIPFSASWSWSASTPIWKCATGARCAPRWGFFF